MAFIYVQQQAHSFTTSVFYSRLSVCRSHQHVIQRLNANISHLQKWFLIRAQFPLGLNIEYDLFVKGLRLAQRLISLGSLIHWSQFLLSFLFSASFGDSFVFVIMLHRNTETKENRAWITKKNKCFSLYYESLCPIILNLSRCVDHRVIGCSCIHITAPLSVSLLLLAMYHWHNKCLSSGLLLGGY